ncbi:MAG: hypothetical protein ABSF35_06350 [Polyangia bacterium]|jgi:hypothetical protein
MRRTFWNAAAIGLLAACTTGCGNGKNFVADLCNKLQSCGELSLRKVSTVSQCTTNCLRQLSQLSSQLGGSDPAAADQALAAADQAIEQCLEIPDCPSFSNCVSTLVNGNLPP